MATPHDTLFRRVFSAPERAAALVRSLVPPRVVADVDWSSLRPLPGTVVDESLRSNHCDLLFEADLGGRPALLFVLLEHKSRPDPWTPFQLLRYEVRFLERWTEQHPRARRLPPILPVVVHLGLRRWRTHRSLRELIELDGVAPELRELQPELRFELHDLAMQDEAATLALPMDAVGRLALLFLQFVRGASPDAALELVVRWQELLAQAGARGPAALVPLWFYFLHVTRTEPERISSVIQATTSPQSVEESMKTAAEQLIDRGIEKGIEKGVAREREQVLLRLVEARFGPQPDAVRSRLRDLRDEDRDRIVDRILTASTVAELFD